LVANNPLVGLVLGSESDTRYIEKGVVLLREFGVPFEVIVSSAHRSPERTRGYAKSAEERGIKVIIAVAGAAAHLAGVIAAETKLPVIGVPAPSSSLAGIDALLSTVQMPAGIPVASMGIGEAGAMNACLLAIEIIALLDPELKGKVARYRDNLVSKLEEESTRVEEKFSRDG
jgi:phosphoribosylaminoimidazole carboxylase PurE protein